MIPIIPLLVTESHQGKALFMTEPEKTAIKQAYQTAAEMTYIVALGLSKAAKKQKAKKQKLEKFYAKEKKRVTK